MNAIIFFLILFLILISGCTQVTSLNMKKHEFGLSPTKIIWFQIAGLEEEHLALLRFQKSAYRKTSFEENTCIGKTLSYNLYNLRNKSQESFLAQLTGKKNIKSSCEDAELKPIWHYLKNDNFTVGILESGATNEQSLVSFNDCGEKGLEFLSSLYLWLRKKPISGAPTFHHLSSIPFIQNKIFFDKSCEDKICYSTIAEDFKSIHQVFRNKFAKGLFLLRDFSFLEAIDKNDFIKARSILVDLDNALSEALLLAKNSQEYLVLVTSGESRFLDMPNQGKDWFEFEKNGTHLQAKRAKLTNFVMASGSRSENFCGFYDDSQIFERILSGPKELGLELKLINPFK